MDDFSCLFGATFEDDAIQSNDFEGTVNQVTLEKISNKVAIKGRQLK